MRYRFTDKVIALELDAAPRIVVEKTFAPGDDALSGPCGPEEVPASLVLELMATTGGHLVLRRLRNTRLPLLLKTDDCRFDAPAMAGMTLRATAEVAGISAASERAVVAEVRAGVHVRDERIASARLLYVCLIVPGVDLAAWETGP